jgi:carbon-monoxide dehydrogenase large subunit
VQESEVAVVEVEVAGGSGPTVDAAPFRRKRGDIMLTGQGEYLDDVQLPGTLDCSILRSPFPNARIVAIDTTAAEAAPGVRAVLTGAAAAEMAGPLPHVFDPVNVGGATAEFRCLAVDRVRYAGTPVVALAAETMRQAESALHLIKIDYEELPFVIDAEAAMAPDAPRVFEDWEANEVGRYTWAEGEPDVVIAAADHVIEDEVSAQRYYTAPMETRGYIAQWKRGDLTLYASSQMPHPLRSHLSSVLGMPENRIRVIAPMVGGGFGHKFHGFEEESTVALLSRMVGQPVRWLETRAESMLVGAREFRYRMSIGFADDGEIEAFKAEVVGNIGALGPWGGWCMTFPAAMTLPGPYRIKHYDVQTIPVVTNKAPWSGARGYGKEAAAMALERMVDLVAAELGMDPAAVRRRNFIPSDEFPYWTAGKRLDSGNYEGALDIALDLADYEGRKRDREEARSEGRLLGVGIGFEITPEGADFSGSFFRGFDTSTVRVDPSGSVTVLTGVTSPGSGNETGIAQIVAAVFGIHIDLVEVVQGDTESCPYGFGNFSSRALTTGGGSARLAALEVREKMAAVAAMLLEVGVEELEFAAGEIRSTAAEKAIPFGRVADQVYRRTVPIGGEVYPHLEATRSDGPGNYQWVPDEQGRMSMYPTFPFSAHVTVAEVDAETGIVKLLEHTSVDDCGVVINETLVRSQIQGAIGMAIGGALYEHAVYGEDGVLETRTFKDYLMPRAPDMPQIRIGSQETPSPFTTMGTKGAGESAVGGTLAAILNAVNDALVPLDARIHTMPLSGPNVLAAIRRGGAR